MNINKTIVTTRTTHIAADLDESEVHAALAEYVTRRSGIDIPPNAKCETVIDVDSRTGGACVSISARQEVEAQ